MLKRLADAATGDDRDALLETMLVSEHIRGQRSVTPLVGLAAAPATVLQRLVYDAGNTKRLPGKLVRSEGGAAAADATVNQAYDSAGATWSFYREILGRNSIDGRGMPIVSSVHFARRFNNAFWNGKQMVYGDGDGKLFLGFAQALDVVGHELTHGVTQYTVPGGGLTYDGESGALNESISDVFGIQVKQWKLGLDVHASDWLIGAGIMAPSCGKALRSMAAPGTAWSGDDQPSDYRNYVVDGDVHTNSGIPNHAFYLAATAIGGNAWEKAGRVWYRALAMLHPDATFAQAAQATIDAANVLFAGTDVPAKVRKAWQDVHVL
jgi:Zn-dependent metalloprotease